MELTTLTRDEPLKSLELAELHHRGVVERCSEVEPVNLVVQLTPPAANGTLHKPDLGDLTVWRSEARRAEHVGTEENKAVVRRFIEDVVTGRDVDVADDVLAPGYVNVAMEGIDITGLKAMTTGLRAAVGEVRIGDLELVAEGDAVFARFDYGLTLPDGGDRTSRVLAYYHLTGGRIDVNDVMMVPELHDVLGPLMAPPAADS